MQGRGCLCSVQMFFLSHISNIQHILAKCTCNYLEQPSLQKRLPRITASKLLHLVNIIIPKQINCLNFIRLMEEILAVKKNVTLLKNYDGTHLEGNLIKPSYQNGKCFNLGPAIRENNVTRDILWFSIVSQNIPNNSGQVKVVFQDPINGGVLLPIVFEMRGDAININTKPENKLRKVHVRPSAQPPINTSACLQSHLQ